MTRTKLSAFTVMGEADLAKNDKELGEWLVVAWLASLAEKQGIPLDAIPEYWAEHVVEAAAKVDSDSVKNVLIESAFRKGFSGDYEAAGRMLRAYMVSEAHAIVSEKYAARGIQAKAGNSKGGKRSAETKKEEVAIWHARCKAAAQELLKSGKQPREVAGILSKRFDRTPTQIRTVLNQTKVK